MPERALDREPLVEVDQIAARQHRPDRVNRRRRQMRKVAKVLVLDLAVLAIRAAKEMRRIDTLALPSRLDCGYVN
jgi:hypothetical protein